jgi:transcriptional regulator
MLTEAQVVEVFTLRADGQSIRGIASFTGLSHAAVHRVLRRETHKDVKVPWDKIVAANEVSDYFTSRYAGAMTNQKIGRMVRLNQAGRTQDEIAADLGVTQPCVSKWLKRLREES